MKLPLWAEVATVQQSKPWKALVQPWDRLAVLEPAELQLLQAREAGNATSRNLFIVDFQMTKRSQWRKVGKVVDLAPTDQLRQLTRLSSPACRN